MEDLPDFLFFVHFGKYIVCNVGGIPPPNEVDGGGGGSGGCGGGGGYTGFTLSVCLSVCLSVRPSVGDMVSGA